LIVFFNLIHYPSHPQPSSLQFSIPTEKSIDDLGSSWDGSSVNLLQKYKFHLGQSRVIWVPFGGDHFNPFAVGFCLQRKAFLQGWSRES
jgi:hypothetical protein